MSKGLEALKHLYAKLSCKSNIEEIDENLQEYEIIEKELKEYDMEHTLRIRLENINYELVREKQESEKKLKALEIIKKKMAFVYVGKDDIMREHFILINGQGFAFREEEYELLKEVCL